MTARWLVSTFLENKETAHSENFLEKSTLRNTLLFIFYVVPKQPVIWIGFHKKGEFSLNHLNYFLFGPSFILPLNVRTYRLA